MFERFTERARQVVVLAQDEARGLQHTYIGTEHILLGLLREEEGLAARVLDSLDITLEEVRAQVGRIVGMGDEQVVSGQIAFTPRARKVLELALEEALSMGHDYIGTEHVLLGIAAEGEGVAARILLDFEVDAQRLRAETIRFLPGGGSGLQASPRRRRQRSRPPQGRSIQFAIGQPAQQLMVACPRCGAPLETVTNPGALSADLDIERRAELSDTTCLGCGEHWSISYHVTWKRRPGGDPGTA